MKDYIVILFFVEKCKFKIYYFIYTLILEIEFFNFLGFECYDLEVMI